MAREPKHANAPKIEFDALAEKLASDPSTYADHVALAGFVGRSAEDGKIRLYVDSTFRSYYEISASDILYTEQLPTTQSPLGGSVVYVKGGAPLRRVQVSAEIEARFLEGPMSSIGGASSLRGAGRAFLRRPFQTLFGAHCKSDAPTSCGDVGCKGRTGDGCGGDTDLGCDTDVLAGCGDTNTC